MAVCRDRMRRRPLGTQDAAPYLFHLSEEGPLELHLLSLLLAAESDELSAALRFHARPGETLLTNTAENNVQGPGHDARISVWT